MWKKTAGVGIVFGLVNLLWCGNANAACSVGNVHATLFGPGERLLVRPPGLPATVYTYTVMAGYKVTGSPGSEDPPLNLSTKYLWSWGSAEKVAGGGINDTSVSIRFSETNDGPTTVSVTYVVTSNYGGGSASASKGVVVPTWNFYLPFACPGGIVAPASGTVVPVATEVPCAVAAPTTDYDERVGETTTHPMGSSILFTWAASAGAFKDGDNTDANVTWVAPNTPTPAAAISVTLDDTGTIPPGELGTRQDPSVSVGPRTVRVAKVSSVTVSPNPVCVGQSGVSVTVHVTDGTNPVSGMTVTFSSADLTFPSGNTATTNASGSATVTATASGTASTAVNGASVTATLGTTLSAATTNFTIVAVQSVTVDLAVVYAGINVTFTAIATPAGQPLNCIQWEKRFRTLETNPWGAWAAASGGDNTAVLNTGTAGLYEYRARNGSGDAWQSAQTTVVTTEYVKVRRTGSGFSFGNSAIIAAGGYATDVHKADVEIKINPVPSGSYSVSVPVSLSNAEGYITDNVKAKLSIGGITIDGDGSASLTFSTSDGKLTGALTSSNRLQTCTITSNTASGAVAFKWDYAGAYDFSFPEYFLSGVPDQVHFFPTLNAVCADGAIDGPHSIPFYTLSADLLCYSFDFSTGTEAESTVTVNYPSYSGIPFGKTMGDLITHTATTVAGTGDYENTQTVFDYYDIVGDEFQMIEVDTYIFAVYDEHVYD